MERNEREIAERKAKVSELLAQDRQKLLMRQPFVGSLIMRLDLVPVYDQRLDTAATDGDRIYVDLDFYGKLDANERLFVLAHEAWHCALLHFNRRQNRDRFKFNIAADLEIHFLLSEEGFHAPFVLPHDPKWQGLSAEEIYEKLNVASAKTLPNKGSNTSNIKGQSGQGFDRHLERGDEGGGQGEREGEGQGEGGGKGRGEIGFDPDYKVKIDAGTLERCRERLTAAAQMYARLRGDLPAGLKGICRAFFRNLPRSSRRLGRKSSRSSNAMRPSGKLRRSMTRIPSIQTASGRRRAAAERISVPSSSTWTNTRSWIPR